MKKKQYIRRMILLNLFLVISTVIIAQNPVFKYEMRNDSLLSSSVYEFDLYLCNTGGNTFELATIQAGINFNPSIKTGGSISASMIANSSELNTLQAPAAGNVNNSAILTKNAIILTGRSAPGTGNGTIISSTTPGTRVLRIRITHSMSFPIGEKSNLTWSFSTTTGYITAVSAYVNNTNTAIINATTNNSYCTTDLLNLPSFNKPITVKTIIGNSNTITVPASEDDLVYYCIKQGITPTLNDTITKSGTGSDLVFNNLAIGTYKVTAHRPATYMYEEMTGSYNVNSLVTWTGAIDNDWNNSGNWNPGVIPTNFYNVFIPAGLTNYPTLDAPATINNLTIESNATGSGSLIINAALTVNGTTTVERYLEGPWKWHFLSSPVIGQKIVGATNFIDFNNNPGNVDFYSLDPTNISTPWINIKNSSGTLNTSDWGSDPEFAVGKSYLVSYSTSVTKAFVGTLNTNALSPNLVAGNYNLIGNPYTSAINWDNSAINKTNLNSQFCWIYNESKSGGAGYEEFSGGKIAAMQGFFVESGANTSFTIPLSARSHHNQAYLKSTSAIQENIKLEFSNGNKWDNTRIELNSNASTGKDWYDALKMFSLDNTVPQIYTINSSGQKFAVNSLPEIVNNTMIPIGIYVPSDGNYSITVSDINTLTSVNTIDLEDMKTNTFYNLMQNHVYNFYSLSNDTTVRFRLHFNSTIGISEIYKNINIYAFSNIVYINTNENINQIYVYNSLGQIIKKISGINNLKSFTLNGLSASYYIVKVITDENVYSKKVWIE